MALTNLTIPTRSVGTGTPAADMNAVVTKVNAIIAAVEPPVAALSGATPTWAAVNNQTANLTASADTTITATFASSPVSALLFFTQDATGSRALTINGQTAEVNPAANSVTLIGLAYNGTTLKIVTDYAVSTGGATDTTAPLRVSATVADATPTKINIVFSEPLDTASVPATGDFTVSGKTVSAVEVVGSNVNLTVSVAFAYSESSTVSYTGGTNKIKDIAGNIAANFSTVAITNNVAAGATTYATPTGLTATHTVEDNGIKKVSGSGFGDPVRFVETLTVGKRFIVQEGNNADNMTKMFGITTNATPTGYPDIYNGINISSDDNLYQLTGGSSALFGGTSGYDPGEWFAVEWRAADNKIWYMRSSNGTTWTDMTFATSTPSGTYYCMVTIDAAGGKLNNIQIG